MEEMDMAAAARVWRRVQGDTPEEPLESLIMEEWTDSVNYLYLSRMLTGDARNILRRMFQEEQSHISCLKGIYAIQDQPFTGRFSPPPPRGTPEAILRCCYGREMRCLARYEKYASHRDFGQVFSLLAECEREHCRRILHLLGDLPR